MRSSIVSVIHAVIVPRATRVFIRRVIRSHSHFDRGQQLFFELRHFTLFSAKNATVTASILELPLAQFKTYHLLFSNHTVFVRVQVKTGNVLLLLSGFLHERDQKLHIQAKLFRVSGIKSWQIVNL